MHSKQKHEIGTTREKVRFAFFPVTINSRLIWFIRYKAIQKYTETTLETDFWSEEEYETVYSWVTIERKLIRR